MRCSCSEFRMRVWLLVGMSGIRLWLGHCGPGSNLIGGSLRMGMEMDRGAEVDSAVGTDMDLDVKMEAEVDSAAEMGMDVGMDLVVEMYMHMGVGMELVYLHGAEVEVKV